MNKNVYKIISTSAESAHKIIIYNIDKSKNIQLYLYEHYYRYPTFTIKGFMYLPHICKYITDINVYIQNTCELYTVVRRTVVVEKVKLTLTHQTPFYCRRV